MAPAARLLNPLEAVASQASGMRYVCFTCRRQCLSPPGRLVVHHSRRYNSNVPLTEKIRRKIWGTDKPPGLKDPYGESAFESRRHEERALDESQESEQELDDNSELATPPSEYVAQTTWDKMKSVGNQGNWWNFAPKAKDGSFQPFLGRKKIVDPEQLSNELQTTFVELHTKKHGWEGCQGMDFLGFDLNKDEDFKFNYLKEISQRTGHRIPDQHLAGISTPSELLAILNKLAKPKPKKLADLLAADFQLTSLPNVKIYDRQQTIVHKEMEIGRLKVIEEELAARGLRPLRRERR